MHSNLRSFSAFIGAAKALIILAAISGSHSSAQTLGYLSGGGTDIYAFDPATGQIANAFAGNSYIGAIAVSKDGATLYTAAYPNALQLISASTGQPVSQITGTYAAHLSIAKTIISPGGRYALVAISSDKFSNDKNVTSVVDLTTNAVVAYLEIEGGYPLDIAVSPDQQYIFLSTASKSHAGSAQSGPSPLTTTLPVHTCSVVPGICVFDATTLALAAKVPLAGAQFLAVSQDSQSLYTWNGSPSLYVINTKSFAVSQVDLGTSFYVAGLAVAPSGNEAVIVGQPNLTAYNFQLLDTTTNTTTGAFPVPPVAGVLDIQSGGSAFSPDGTSLWTLNECEGAGVGGCLNLVGQSCPSGDVIAQTPFVNNASAITF